MLTLLSRLPGWAQITALVALSLLFLDAAVAYAVSTTDVIEAFKYTYAQDRLSYLASQEIVLWRILSKRPKPVGGRGQWILPVQTHNTGVWRGHTEGAAKTARRAQPNTAEMTFSLQEFHGIWDTSWKMLQDARNDEYSFQRAVDFMDASMRRRVFRLLNADLLGTGRGELGVMPAADDATTATFSSLPMVDLGMIVDVMDASDNNALIADGVTVDGINVRTREVTFSGALAGSAAGDYIVTADSVATAGSLHTLGIRAWIDDANPVAVVGNIGGIDRSTAGNEWAQGSVLDNSGTNRPLTEDLLLQGSDLTRERGGVMIDTYMSNLAIIRRYHESLREDIFYAVGDLKMPSGAGYGRNESEMQQGEEGQGKTPYKFSGVPWHAEPFFIANQLIGFAKDHYFIGHGENEVPAPLSEIFDGMIPFFTHTANTTFEVVSYWQGELLCDNTLAGVKWEDIAES